MSIRQMSNEYGKNRILNEDGKLSDQVIKNRL